MLPCQPYRMRNVDDLTDLRYCLSKVEYFFYNKKITLIFSLEYRLKKNRFELTTSKISMKHVIPLIFLIVIFPFTAVIIPRGKQSTSSFLQIV